MIIAVDGPAASGKGTIARALAAHFAMNDNPAAYLAILRPWLLRQDA